MSKSSGKYWKRQSRNKSVQKFIYDKKLAFTVRKTKVKFTQNAGLLTLTRVLHTENPTFFVKIIECINCGHIYDDHVTI